MTTMPDTRSTPPATDLDRWSWVDAADGFQPGKRGRAVRPLARREVLVKQTIGAEIRRLRLAAEMTMDQLAARLSMSQPAVSYLERYGGGLVSASLLFDLADVFRVPASTFLDVAAGAVADVRLVTPKPARKLGQKPSAPSEPQRASWTSAADALIPRSPV